MSRQDCGDSPVSPTAEELKGNPIIQARSKRQTSGVKRKRDLPAFHKTSSQPVVRRQEDEQIGSHKRYVRCDVCGRPDPEADNSLVICSGCDVAVHQTCYGVAFIPEGPWFCHRCAMNYDPSTTKCQLCGHTGGAMLPIGKLPLDPQADGDGKKRIWAHALCGLWMPDVQVRRSSPDYTGHLYMSIKNVDRNRFRLLKCSLCSEYHREGACIQCSGGRCRKSVHPYCARSRLKDPTKGEFVDEPSWTLLEMARSDKQFEYHCRCPAHVLNNGQVPPPSGLKNVCFLRARIHGGREIEFSVAPGFVNSLKGTRKGQKKRGSKSSSTENGQYMDRTGGGTKVPISRFRGVWWSMMRYQWLASVQMNGVNVPLGYYDSDVTAAQIVDQFIKEQHLNQPLNFPNGVDAVKDQHKLATGTRKEEKKKKKPKKAKKKKVAVVEDEYVGHVEAILGRMLCFDGTTRYLVKWEGFEDIDNTWEPPENLDCPGLVEKFEVKLKDERIRRRESDVGTGNCLHHWENNVWAQCPMRQIYVMNKPFVYVKSCVISSSLLVQNMLTMQEINGSEDIGKEHPLLLESNEDDKKEILGRGSDTKGATATSDTKNLTKMSCFGTVSMKSPCCCAECGIPYMLLVEYMGSNKGFGVIAGEDIPAGSQVCEYVGELLEREVVRRREKTYKKEGLYYLFEPSHASFIIDATFVGGVSRFINHSCSPNCKSKEIVQPEMLNLSGTAAPSPPRVVYIASKDIKKGEELTIDYIPSYTEDTVLQKQVKCFCKSPNCRGWVL